MLRPPVHLPAPQAARMEPQTGEIHEQALALACEVIEQHQLTDVKALLKAAQARTAKTELNVGVFGRLKAGKSSFLNCLIGRAVLPVGVLPVTSVITEISYGADDSASVVFQKNETPQSISLTEIADYTSEAANPENRKGVERVRIALPSLEQFRGLKLVDTPGLESIFAHNTEAALSWSPNVDLALVAVAVDPPLTQQDVALIERLQRSTPNVSILLTKVDTLDVAEQREVRSFVESQLKTKFLQDLRVFPFSVRPGHEHFRDQFERDYLSATLASFQAAHSASFERKLRTLFRTVGDYLRLALRAADAKETDREKLRSAVLGSDMALADHRLQFQLLAKHAMAQTRPKIEQRLRKVALRPLQQKLEASLRDEFPTWRGSFGRIVERFESWLLAELTKALADVTGSESNTFHVTLHDLQRQYQENLQGFREQLAERVLRLFGTVLRTSEAEIAIQPPGLPDVSVGKSFDHNWEFVAPLVPQRLVRSALRRRFEEKLKSEIEKNMSRLTSQWEGIVTKAIHATEKEAQQRFDELVFTVRRLLGASDSSKANLLLWGEKIEATLQQLQAPEPS